MNTSCFIDAEAVDVDQPKETSDAYIDIYCKIFFSPYQKQDIENQIDTASLFRQNGHINQKEIDNKILNGQCDFIGDFLFPKVVYESYLCGTNKGDKIESKEIFIDCSKTADQIQLEIEDVHDLLQKTECELKKILEKYWLMAKYVKLHLAIFSFTLTEDIANCFLYSVYPSPDFYPEDHALRSHFVTDNPLQLLSTYLDRGMFIDIDYVLVYDAEPFLQTLVPLKEVFADNHPNSPTNTNKNSNPDILPSFVDASQTTTEFKDLVPNPDGSWRIKSEFLHSTSQDSSKYFSRFALGGLIVAAGASVVAVVAVVTTGGAAAVPIALAVAGGSLKFSAAMGTAALTASTVDNYTSLADYVIEGDEEALKSAKVGMTTELIWQGATFGAGKGAKSLLKGRTPFGGKLVKELKDNEQLLVKDQYDLQGRIRTRQDSIVNTRSAYAKTTRTSAAQSRMRTQSNSTKRQRYQIRRQELQYRQKQSIKNQTSAQRKDIEQFQRNQAELNEILEKQKNIVNANDSAMATSKEMFETLVEDPTKKGIKKVLNVTTKDNPDNQTKRRNADETIPSFEKDPYASVTIVSVF